MVRSWEIRHAIQLFSSLCHISNGYHSLSLLKGFLTCQRNLENSVFFRRGIGNITLSRMKAMSQQCPVYVWCVCVCVCERVCVRVSVPIDNVKTLQHTALVAGLIFTLHLREETVSRPQADEDIRTHSTSRWKQIWFKEKKRWFYRSKVCPLLQIMVSCF